MRGCNRVCIADGAVQPCCEPANRQPGGRVAAGRLGRRPQPSLLNPRGRPLVVVPQWALLAHAPHFAASRVGSAARRPRARGAARCPRRRALPAAPRYMHPAHAPHLVASRVGFAGSYAAHAGRSASGVLERGHLVTHTSASPWQASPVTSDLASYFTTYCRPPGALDPPEDAVVIGISSADDPSDATRASATQEQLSALLAVHEHGVSASFASTPRILVVTALPCRREWKMPGGARARERDGGSAGNAAVWRAQPGVRSGKGEDLHARRPAPRSNLP